MLLFAAYGRSSLARSRRWLEMASKCYYLLHVPLEPGPEPQMARNGCSSPPRSRNWLEMAARARPGAAEYLKSANRVCPGAAECSTGASRVYPGTAECSTGAARATPEEDARQVPLEPALEPQHARKVPLEPTVRCVRFLRSQWPLEKCCPLFVFYRHHILLGSTLLRACYARVHTSIYINILPRTRAFHARNMFASASSATGIRGPALRSVSG